MIRPLVHTGNSANIDYYRETGYTERSREPYVWVEVLNALPWFSDPVNGQPRVDRSKPNTYSITIYRARRGQVAKTTYVRKRGRDTLPDRTVTRLVREALGER